MFRDRREAGQLLAMKLSRYADRNDAVVLGLPRGGVPVAYEIAKALNLPLDVLLVRKLGAPAQPELAMGAIAGNGVKILDYALVRELGISEGELSAAIQREEGELHRCESIYRKTGSPSSLASAYVILVDDGIATGSSMLVAIQVVRARNPARVIVAVPVAPSAARQQIEAHADEFVCLRLSEHFPAVSSFYRDFSQIGEDAVRELLARSKNA
ncbi:phosphoribosyltransferase [Acidobacterium sp. S8]|uniref:phosphoribosyltransferase n=1 Tax=Acidobacterium sp. S8 TaxID=1641854 RepID=UPI001C206DDA|nr:phosphoribosyltransferase [Acidobacterium sp. S8]